MLHIGAVDWIHHHHSGGTLMKRTRLVAGIAAAALGLGIAGPALDRAFAAPPTNQPWTQASASALPTSPLSDAEKATLLRMADEERMARDLYTKIAEKYPEATQFSRVAKSEQMHYDRVLALLDTYHLTKPSDTPGTYADTGVQKLYNDWWTQAQKSQDEAYKVGIALEKADVADLEAAVKQSDNADLDQVYGRLLTASQRHEQAFSAGPGGATALGTGQGRMNGQGGMNGQGAMNGQGRGGMNGQGAHDGSCLQN